MLYRVMPQSDEKLSVLGFGCMRLPEKDKKIDEEAAGKLIRQAIDNGVNYIDTAVLYHNGQCEGFLGRLLKQGLRDRVKLATKLPPWQVKNRADMDIILDAQLQRLQTDHIDYYLLHSLNQATWDKMKNLGIGEFLDQAKKDGRIRFAGFSFHGSKDAFPKIVDGYNWDFCQIQYNYLDEKNQAGTVGLEYAAAKKLGIIIMEPLRGGNLGRKVPPSAQALFDSSSHKRTPAEWALRWVWNRPEVTVVLSGMNREENLQENLRIAGESAPNTLTPDELRLIKQVEQEFRRLMKIGCTGCQYCMPCPQNVDIPGSFEAYNNHHMFADRNAGMFYLFRSGGFLGKPTMASQCVACGKCEKACPQHLSIIHDLKLVVKQFEGPAFNVKRRAFKFVLGVQRWADTFFNHFRTPR